MTAALHTLLEHAERERDEALAALLQTEDAARRMRAQAEQLLGYRDDYRARHPAQGGRCANIELIRCHQNFMLRLEQALQQQQVQVQNTEARCAALRGALVALETRVASVRKLLDRRLHAARQTAARQEQRRSDEVAQQQHRRREDAGPSMGLRAGAGVAPLTH